MLTRCVRTMCISGLSCSACAILSSEAYCSDVKTYCSGSILMYSMFSLLPDRNEKGAVTTFSRTLPIAFSTILR